MWIWVSLFPCVLCLQLFPKRVFRDMWKLFFAGQYCCPYWHVSLPTVRVKALKGTQSTNPSARYALPVFTGRVQGYGPWTRVVRTELNPWPGLIHSLATTRHWCFGLLSDTSRPTRTSGVGMPLLSSRFAHHVKRTSVCKVTHEQWCRYLTMSSEVIYWCEWTDYHADVAVHRKTCDGDVEEGRWTGHKPVPPSVCYFFIRDAVPVSDHWYRICRKPFQ